MIVFIAMAACIGLLAFIALALWLMLRATEEAHAQAMAGANSLSLRIVNLEKVNYLLRDDVSTLELQREALSEEIGRVMLHRNELQQRYRAEEADRELKAENKRIWSEWGKRTAAKRWVKLKVAA